MTPSNQLSNPPETEEEKQEREEYEHARQQWRGVSIKRAIVKKGPFDFLAVLLAIAGFIVVYWQAWQGQRQLNIAEQARIDDKAKDAETKAEDALKREADDARIAETARIERERFEANLSVTQRSLEQAAEQVRGARAALRLEQRAWVLVVSLSDVYLGNYDPITVHLHNAGRTPPKDLEVRGGAVIWGRELPADPFKRRAFGGAFDSEVFGMGFDVARSVSRVTSIALNHDYTVEIPTSGLTPPDDTKLESGDLRLYAIGRVTYKDIFGDEHSTTFCQWQVWPRAGWRLCGPKNLNDFN